MMFLEKTVPTTLVVSLLLTATTAYSVPKRVTASSNTITTQVSSSSDDARSWEGKNRGDTRAATHYIGKIKNKQYVHGLRFGDVAVPPGAHVTNATLELYSAGDVGAGSVVMKLAAEQTTNSATFSDAGDLPEGRRTFASVIRNINPTAWESQGFSAATTIDVTSVVQAVVDQTGWRAGNALSIIERTMTDSTGYISYSTYDRASDRAPRLTISFDMSDTDVVTTTPITPVPEPAPTTPSTPAPGITTAAWVYPGRPACEAATAYSDGRNIDVLKPEYFTVTAAGDLQLLSEAVAGCNGFSTTNVSSIRANSQQSFVTVSAGGAQTKAFVEGSWARQSTTIKTLVDFVTAQKMDGVEIDFEGFGAWSSATYYAYLRFLSELGLALHAANKQLMVDVPPIGTTLEESYYQLTYKDIASLPIDYIVVMAYDYQYDYGAGQAVAPHQWVERVVTNAQRYIAADRLVVGMPAYGYYGTVGSYNLTVTTSELVAAKAGAASFTRDAQSAELMAVANGVAYVYQDGVSLRQKRALLESLGVKHISVWALGGNVWFE